MEGHPGAHRYRETERCLLSSPHTRVHTDTHAPGNKQSAEWPSAYAVITCPDFLLYLTLRCKNPWVFPQGECMQNNLTLLWGYSVLFVKPVLYALYFTWHITYLKSDIINTLFALQWIQLLNIDAGNKAIHQGYFWWSISSPWAYFRTAMCVFAVFINKVVNGAWRNVSSCPVWRQRPLCLMFGTGARCLSQGTQLGPPRPAISGPAVHGTRPAQYTVYWPQRNAVKPPKTRLVWACWPVCHSAER